MVLVGSSSTNQLAASKKSNRGLVVSVALVALAMVVSLVLARYVVGVVVDVDLVEYLVVFVVVVDALCKYRASITNLLTIIVPPTIKLPTIVHFIATMVP